MFRPIRYVDSESFVMEVTYAVTESLHVTEHFAFGTALFFFFLSFQFSLLFLLFFYSLFILFLSRQVFSFFRYFYEFQILTRVFQVFCNSVLISVFLFSSFFSPSLFPFFLFFLSFFRSLYFIIIIFQYSAFFPPSVLTVIQTLLVMSGGFQAACVTFLLR